MLENEILAFHWFDLIFLKLTSFSEVKKKKLQKHFVHLFTYLSLLFFVKHYA